MGVNVLGASLIIGLFVRFSSILGVLLMALYYIPLGFPYPNPEFLHCGPAYYLYRRFVFLRFHKKPEEFSAWMASASIIIPG